MDVLRFTDETFTGWIRDYRRNEGSQKSLFNFIDLHPYFAPISGLATVFLVALKSGAAVSRVLDSLGSSHLAPCI
jgi:hypothetical protein